MDFEELFEKGNASLSHLQLELRQCVSEEDRQLYVAVIQKFGDAMKDNISASHQSFAALSKAEVFFARKLVPSPFLPPYPRDRNSLHKRPPGSPWRQRRLESSDGARGKRPAALGCRCGCAYQGDESDAMGD